MKIAIGCDHAGIDIKDEVIRVLNDLKVEIIDCGTDSHDSVDYPIFAEKVANLVASKKVDAGVLMCGTGIGISIAANKVKGIRCAVVTDTYTAKMTKEHNNANIIAMGSRVLKKEAVEYIIKAWFNAEFLGDKHLKRINLIADIENKNFK